MSRRLRSRRTPDMIAHLSPATRAVLLAGFAAVAPEPSAHGFGSGFLQLFEPHDAGIVRLWTTHRAALLDQARAWGWAPAFEMEGRCVFFGEWIASIDGASRGNE